MSGATESPAKAPKTMSSKLLTMKFMQRAAASSPISTPSTPDQPSPKRQKLGDLSPPSLDLSSIADQRAVQAALAADEAKRQIALERQAVAAGDTRWVLTFKPEVNTPQVQGKAAIRVVETGFADIDYALPSQGSFTDGYDGNSDYPQSNGRRSFGKFNRTVEKMQNPLKSDSSDADTDEDDEEKSVDESEDSEDDDPTGTNSLIKAAQEANTMKLKVERKEKRKAEQAELLRLAEKRKKKDIKLNRLTSISGSGTSKGPWKSAGLPKTCYQCGKPGHKRADCPEAEN